MKRLNLDANETQALITALENYTESMDQSDEDAPVLDDILNRLMED